MQYNFTYLVNSLKGILAEQNYLSVLTNIFSFLFLFNMFCFSYANACFILKLIKGKQSIKTNWHYSVNTSLKLAWNSSPCDLISFKNVSRRQEKNSFPQILTTCHRLLHQVLNVCAQLFVVDFHIDQPLWTKEKYKRIFQMSIKNSVFLRDLILNVQTLGNYERSLQLYLFGWLSNLMESTGTWLPSLSWSLRCY